MALGKEVVKSSIIIATKGNQLENSDPELFQDRMDSLR